MRHEEPLEGDLRVARAGQREGVVELRAAGPGAAAGEAAAGTGAARAWSTRESRVRARPGRPGRPVLAPPRRRARGPRRPGRGAAAGRPGRSIHSSSGTARTRAPSRGKEVLAQVLDEVRGRDALEREVIEVAAQEPSNRARPKSSSSERRKSAPFLVRQARGALVGIAPREVDVQDLVAVLEPGDLVLEVLAAEHRLHAGRLRAVDLLDDAPLDVGREALVQPEVAPGRVGDEVARPRVGQLVRDQRRPGSCPRRAPSASRRSGADSPSPRTGKLGGRTRMS